ncbi:alpha/beta fold hydrolase [Arthrobacter sp. H14]|uniref:alpha/beta fold hydrolase n=1 Tax=Arthrobacter sp. H14 TaxID=1312959 RepID=UPI0004B1EC37|nr:alpha/beta hydrolase [Arthrobacter sp. H14]
MMTNGEKIVNANGVDLCVETFGDPKDPAILLVHGASASMLWWEAELCEKIATGGRFVIRFDNRDTGKSVNYPTGQPGYSLRDMTEDALGILDVLGIHRAHLVGRSMAGVIISLAGIDYADRVASLTFVSTTPCGDGLPPMSDEFMKYTSQNPDPSDSKAVVEFIAGLMMVYSADSPYGDEKAMRAIAEADVARADNIASTLTNHFVINFDSPEQGGPGDITAPTLVPCC